MTIKTIIVTFRCGSRFATLSACASLRRHLMPSARGAACPSLCPSKTWTANPLCVPARRRAAASRTPGCDSLYLVEAWVGDGPRLVLSKTPLIPDRVDALVARWEHELAEEQAKAMPPESSRNE